MNNALPTDVGMAKFFELFGLAKDEPGIAMLFEEFLKIGAPVLVTSIDDEATKRAGHFVHRFDFDERLERLLAAARTGEWKHWQRDWIERHGIPPQTPEGKHTP
jgi:hypothetical protein